MTISKRLNEVLSTAATDATRALSKLLNQSMKLEVIDIGTVTTDVQHEILRLFPLNGGTILMSTKLFGRIEGVSTLILSKASALKLCDILLHRGVEKTTLLNHLEQSALLEIGNIVVGCFLNSLGVALESGNILHKKLSMSIMQKSEVPKFTDLLTKPQELMVRTSFQIEHGGIEGICAFFFNKSILKAAFIPSRVEST